MMSRREFITTGLTLAGAALGAGRAAAATKPPVTVHRSPT
jgi:hypothetical protein